MRVYEQPRGVSSALISFLLFLLDKNGENISKKRERERKCVYESEGGEERAHARKSEGESTNKSESESEKARDKEREGG